MRLRGLVVGKETMPEEDWLLLVGIDWAKEAHEFCALQPDRKAVAQGSIEHSGSGIAQFIERLLKLSENQPGRVAISIETPRGAVVESLLERGFAVFALNPKQMDRFRDRHCVAGSKSDQFDALVLADSLRTDMHLFRRVKLDDPLIIRLRELSRTEEDLQQTAVRFGHQLRELLVRYYPQMLHLCPGVDEPWFWTLVEWAPVPAQAGKLKQKKVEELLRSHRIRRHTADDVLKKLREPALYLAPGAAEAASEHVLFLLPLLRRLREQREQVAARITEILNELSEPGQLNEHRDAAIILSLPGVGRVAAATMLAEASEAIQDRDYHALRSYGGAAPITRRSGKSRVVLMRRGCNIRLRNAFYHWARVSAQHDERSQRQYQQLRAKGHSHGRALRGVTDRLLAVLIAMLQAGTLYDPAFGKPALAESA